MSTALITPGLPTQAIKDGFTREQYAAGCARPYEAVHGHAAPHVAAHVYRAACDSYDEALARLPVSVSDITGNDSHECSHSCDPATCAVAAAGLREMEARYVGE